MLMCFLLIGVCMHDDVPGRTYGLAFDEPHLSHLTVRDWPARGPCELVDGFLASGTDSGIKKNITIGKIRKKTSRRSYSMPVEPTKSTDIVSVLFVVVPILITTMYHPVFFTWHVGTTWSNTLGMTSRGWEWNRHFTQIESKIRKPELSANQAPRSLNKVPRPSTSAAFSSLRFLLARSVRMLAR
ncbi:hypothetical protein F4782DRAFT_514163 [Xylaria castorea]|nr:hypothetical protein F4782DRAFT_514163 [Xylaria castorea]